VKTAAAEPLVGLTIISSYKPDGCLSGYTSASVKTGGAGHQRETDGENRPGRHRDHRVDLPDSSSASRLIAGQLNARKVATANGGRWRHVQVRQILERAGGSTGLGLQRSKK
jgi:hypothetical protein